MPLQIDPADIQSTRRTNIIVERQLSRGPDCLGVFIFQEVQFRDGRIVRGHAVDVIAERNDEGVAHRPVLTITMADAQQLMDSLWDAGLKPSQGFGSPGQVEALKQHLAFAERVADDTKKQVDRLVEICGRAGGLVGSTPGSSAGIIQNDGVMPASAVDRFTSLDQALNPKFANRSGYPGVPVLPKTESAPEPVKQDPKPKRKGWLRFVRGIAGLGDTARPPESVSRPKQ